MLKKTKVFIVLVIIMIVVAGVLMILRAIKEKHRQDFLNQLQGKIVFTRRDTSGVSDIWKINANGTDEKMVFHNDKYGGEAMNFNSGDPEWSSDGKKVYFKSIGEGNIVQFFEIDMSNNKIMPIVDNVNTDYSMPEISRFSREQDILVENGDVFYINSNNEKIKVYDYKHNCDPKLCPGASEASWSPDKNYIIFNGPQGIMIADKQGNVFKLTEGSDPDWK